MEIHWDLSETIGTAQALEALGTIPESISLDISLGTECGNCHKPVNYVERHTEHQGASGDWLHDDGSPNCCIFVENDRTCKVTPVMIRTMLSLRNCENTIVIRTSSPGEAVLEGSSFFLKRVRGSSKAEGVL
jgi:hypothetical protein